MEITFKQGKITHHSSVTAIEKDNEFQYALDLGPGLQFTIRLSDDGYWETDNAQVDSMIVMYAGDAIENMEDFSDVLAALG